MTAPALPGSLLTQVGSFTAGFLSNYTGVSDSLATGTWTVRPQLRDAFVITDLNDYGGIGGPYFGVGLGSVVAQDEFKYILINGVMFPTVSATFGTGGGLSSWTWPGIGNAGLSNGVSYTFVIGY